MFCSKCGAEALEESKFCNKCGNNFKTGFQISNTALLLAAIAATIALGAAFLPIGSKTDTKTEADQARPIATPSPVAIEEPAQAQVSAPQPQAATPTPMVVSMRIADKSQSRPQPAQIMAAQPQVKADQIKQMVIDQFAAQPTTPKKCSPPREPKDGAVFPGDVPAIDFQWDCDRRDDATGYIIEIQYDEPGEGWKVLTRMHTDGTKYQVRNFNDPKPGRWRITADRGDASEPGDWHYFRRSTPVPDDSARAPAPFANQDQPQDEPQPPAGAQPIRVHQNPIVRQRFTVAPGTYVFIPVPAGSWLSPVIKGSFSAAGGAGNDIFVYVVNFPQFQILKSNRPGPVLYNSGQVSGADFQVHLQPLRPQPYWIILDNRFSTLSAKNVEIEWQTIYIERPE